MLDMISLEEFKAGLHERRIWLIEEGLWDYVVFGETDWGKKRRGPSAFSDAFEKVEIEVEISDWE